MISRSNISSSCYFFFDLSIVKRVCLENNFFFLNFKGIARSLGYIYDNEVIKKSLGIEVEQREDSSNRE